MDVSVYTDPTDIVATIGGEREQKETALARARAADESLTSDLAAPAKEAAARRQELLHAAGGASRELLDVRYGGGGGGGGGKAAKVPLWKLSSPRGGQGGHKVGAPPLAQGDSSGLFNLSARDAADTQILTRLETLSTEVRSLQAATQATQEAQAAQAAQLEAAQLQRTLLETQGELRDVRTLVLGLSRSLLL